MLPFFGVVTVRFESVRGVGLDILQYKETYYVFTHTDSVPRRQDLIDFRLRKDLGIQLRDTT